MKETKGLVRQDDAIRVTLDEVELAANVKSLPATKVVKGTVLPIVRLCAESGNLSVLHEKTGLPTDDVLSSILTEVLARQHATMVDMGHGRDSFASEDQPLLFTDNICNEPMNSKDFTADVPPLVRDGIKALQVPRVINMAMYENMDDLREWLPSAEAEKFVPGYIMDDLDRFKDGSPFVKRRDVTEDAQRVFGRDNYSKSLRGISGLIEPMICNAVGLNAIRTDLRGKGITKKEMDTCIEDTQLYMRYLIKGGEKPSEAFLRMTDIMNAYEVACGRAPFKGVRGDLSASGEAIMECLYRLISALSRIITNMPYSKPAHKDMAYAMMDPEFISSSKIGKKFVKAVKVEWGKRFSEAPLPLVISVAKIAFMIVMYTGGPGAMLEAYLDEDKGHDPNKVAFYSLKKLLREILGDTDNALTNAYMVDFCNQMHKIFHDTFPVCQEFADFWSNKWDTAQAACKASGELFTGLVIPYPGGGQALISSIGFSKKYRRSISTDKILMPNGELVGFTRTMNILEHKGAPSIITAVCRLYDSALLYSTTVEAKELNGGKPVVLDTTHDEIEVEANLFPLVHKASMKAAAKVFDHDLMETGRKKLVFPDNGIMYRQG
jgi:hypothetical protein